MKRGLVLFVLALLLINISFVFAEVVCTDSDGGKNVFEAGDAQADGHGLIDHCDFSNSNGILHEAYCDSSNISSIEMSCPEESPYCNRAVCSSIAPVCSDTDNGINSYVPGSVTEPRLKEGPVNDDYCSNLETNQPWNNCNGTNCGLREFYCSGISMALEDTPCPNGCSDGACVLGANQLYFYSPESLVKEINIDGATYRIELLSASKTSAIIAISKGEGATDQKEITEGTSKVISGLSIKVLFADTDNQEYLVLIEYALAPPCSDTDGGSDYNVKGTITYFFNNTNSEFYGWHINEDQCNDEDGMLEEYTCKNYNPLELFPSIKYNCSNGCSDGACILSECDTHGISIGQVYDKDGKIGVEFKYKKVAWNNIDISLIGISDNAGFGVHCSMVGPNTCSGSSESDSVYCNVMTDCNYPANNPDIKYSLTIKDTYCPNVFDSAELYQGKDSIIIYNGWNLVSVYSIQGIFEKDVSSELNARGIRSVYYYDTINNEYIRLHPNKEQAKLDAFIKRIDPEQGGNFADFAAFTHSSMWVFSNKKQELRFSVYDLPFLEDARMEAGWNFIAVSPQMIGKTLNEWKGNCEIIKAAFWSPEYKKWDIGTGSDFDNPFPTEVLWRGLVIKTAGECYLGDRLTPPPLPKDECSDSDGGLNYFTYGWTNGMFDGVFSTFADSCCQKTGTEYKCDVSYGNSVVETYCEGDYIRLAYYDCPNGCQDGMCIPQATCNDSDNGLNPYVYGFTHFEFGEFQLENKDECAIVDSYDANGTPQGWQSADSCSGSNCYVDESYCRQDANGNFIDADADELIACPEGCSSGACIASESILLKLTTITNNTGPNYPDDIVKLTNVNNLNDIYQATMTSEGSGTITIKGKVYWLNYSVNPYNSDENYIKMMGVDGQVGGNRIYKNGYVAIGTPSPSPPANFWLLKVATIMNNTADFVGDNVVLINMNNDDIYAATITSEGSGTINIAGRVYQLYYNSAGPYIQLKDSDNNYVGGFRIYKNGHVMVPQ